MSDIKYYGNQKCEVIAVIDHESVIELLIGEVGFEHGYDEPPCVEPYHTKIIVDSKYLSDVPLTADGIIADKRRAMQEASAEIAKMTNKARSDIGATKREAEKELVDIRKRVENLESRGLIEYLNFLEGKYEWYVNLDYSIRICKFGEDDNDGDRYRPELCAISFRSEMYVKRNKARLYLSRWGDDSGSSRSAIKCFATLEDAKAWLIDQVETGKILPGKLSGTSQTTYPITCPKIEEYELSQKIEAEKRRIEKAAKLKKELAELQNVGIPPTPLAIPES